MEGKEGKERKRDRIRDRLGRYTGKEEGIVSEEMKVLNLLPGSKNLLSTAMNTKFAIKQTNYNLS